MILYQYEVHANSLSYPSIKASGSGGLLSSPVARDESWLVISLPSLLDGSANELDRGSVYCSAMDSCEAVRMVLRYVVS
jgi:hypothetical protein